MTLGKSSKDLFTDPENNGNVCHLLILCGFDEMSELCTVGSLETAIIYQELSAQGDFLPIFTSCYQYWVDSAYRRSNPNEE